MANLALHNVASELPVSALRRRQAEYEVTDDQLLIVRIRGKKQIPPAAIQVPGFQIKSVSIAAGERILLPVGIWTALLIDFESEGPLDLSAFSSIKNQLPQAPFVVLSKSNSPIDKILALELGADDYLTRPYHPRELNARLQAILRRRPVADFFEPHSTTARIGSHQVDLVNRALVTNTGTTTKLTKGEYWLLRALLDSRGQIMSRQSIERYLNEHCEDEFGQLRSVDVLISRLRKKIDQKGEPSLIVTVRSEGYRL